MLIPSDAVTWTSNARSVDVAGLLTADPSRETPFPSSTLAERTLVGRADRVIGGSRHRWAAAEYRFWSAVLGPDP